MKPFYRAAVRGRCVPLTTTRQYASTPRLFQPTALHRAEAAADLKAHPESQLTQEKLPDKEHSHHWDDANATPSEADVWPHTARGWDNSTDEHLVDQS
ncbi:hypothetical protein A1O1_08743, partial [Capronia coronata CBS 617.96]